MWVGVSAWSPSTAALSAAVLTFGLVGPANADPYGIDDPKDSPHGSDLRAVQLKNGDRNVVVTTHHANSSAARSVSM